jgi:hypothetical protein
MIIIKYLVLMFHPTIYGWLSILLVDVCCSVVPHLFVPTDEKITYLDIQERLY